MLRWHIFVVYGNVSRDGAELVLPVWQKEGLYESEGFNE